LEKVKHVVQNLIDTIATIPDLVQQGTNEATNKLRAYLETRIVVVREQVDRANTTIAAVNNSLNMLRNGVTKLQQSRGTRFDHLKKELKIKKTKYNKLITWFNALQAKVSQDAFELSVHQKIARENKEDMEKKMRELEAGHLFLITEIENVKKKESATPSNTVPPKQPLYQAIPPSDPSRHPSYNAVP
jgi:chromosome segregation ATPase